MSGLSYEWVLERSLCRQAHCSSASVETRRQQIEYIQYAHSYGEPGYDDPAKGILFGDWNYFSKDAVDILERMGYSCEWEDEWTTCCECGKALRTSATSYGWKPSYFASDCEITCRECTDMESYLESLEDDPSTALNNDDINPEEYGYELVQGEFENGFHPGQNDNPKAIYARLKDQGYSRLLFVIDNVGQFDMEFSVWRKITDTE